MDVLLLSEFHTLREQISLCKKPEIGIVLYAKHAGANSDFMVHSNTLNNSEICIWMATKVD